MTDILSTLAECSWRGISFPILSITEDGSQDLAVHKRMDRDGAYVESTGRAPFTYKITAVFVNTIAKGRSETWDNLFPSTFIKLRSAWADRTSGILNHPLYGEIKCKPATWAVPFNADTRGGCFVDLTFIETIDDSEESTVIKSDYAFAKQTAISLDSNLGLLVPPPQVFFETDDYSSFTDFLDSLTAVVDSASLAAQKALANIDRMVAKLDRLSNSIDRAAHVFNTDPLTQITTDLGELGLGAGRIFQDSINLATALLTIKSNILNKTNKDIKTYLAEKQTTLVSISIKLKNSTKELYELNPGLANRRGPIIPEFTLIKYYNKE